MIKDNDKVVEVSGVVEDNIGKYAEVPKKVTPMPRPPAPFPQILVTKTDDGNYGHLITMLKHLSVNFP